MSKYEPLQLFLRSRAEGQIPLSFEEIESILGFDLPQSARKYAPWWSNVGGTHVQASAWLEAGWRTSSVDVSAARVIFVRAASRSTAIAKNNPKTLDSVLDAQVVLTLEALSPAARALLDRHIAEHDCSPAQAVCELLHQAAMDRRRKLLDRFPLSGAPSAINSVDLIREDRDAR